MAVTGGSTSRGLAVDGPSSPSPLPPGPGDGLPDGGSPVESPAPPVVAPPDGFALEPALGAEEDVLWAADDPGFPAIWSKIIATATISTARQMPAIANRRAIMAYPGRLRCREVGRPFHEGRRIELTPPILWWRCSLRWRFEAPSCSWGQSAIAIQIPEQFWGYQRPFRGRGWQTGQV